MKIAVVLASFPNTYQNFTYVRLNALAEKAEVAIFPTQRGEDYLYKTSLIKNLFEAKVKCLPIYGSGSVLNRYIKLFGKLINPRNFVFFLKMIRRCTSKKKSLRKTLGIIYTFYPLLFWQPDIVHIETSYVGIGIAQSIMNILSCPVVVSLRGSDVDEKPSQSNRWRDWYITSANYPQLYFHCVSNYIKKKVLELGVLESKCHVIYQGIDSNKFVISQEDRGKGEREGIIVVSRLSPEKGIDTLISSFGTLVKKHNNLVLEIIGDGPEKEHLENIVNSQGLNNQVHFLGRQGNDWVVRRLMEVGDSYIYVQPSNREAFGQAILEAMLAKMPIVASNVGGIPEVVLDGVTGILCQPKDPEGMASKIMQLLNNPDLSNRLAECAQVRAITIFKDTLEAKLFLEWYANLINSQVPL